MSADKYLMNRIGNAGNFAQGNYKRVLCVCSAGLLRSPTAALVLSQAPFHFNTRAAGAVPQFALIPVDQVLLAWADEVVCMEPEHETVLNEMLKDSGKKVICLDIQDSFKYRSPSLMKLIADKYTEKTGFVPEET